MPDLSSTPFFVLTNIWFTERICVSIVTVFCFLPTSSYLSFWGGAETGGCCNYFSGLYPAGPGNTLPGSSAWGLTFSIQVMETVRSPSLQQWMYLPELKEQIVVTLFLDTVCLWWR